MRRQIALATVLIGLAAPAAAGSLDFWEDSRGAEDVTAVFPTGVAQTAHIVFDASSAETGGLVFGATEIEIRAHGSMDFVAWDCELQGCNQSDYIFDEGTESTTPRPGRVAVSDPDLDPKFGPYDLGTITFNGPQERQQRRGSHGPPAVPRLLLHLRRRSRAA